MEDLDIPLNKIEQVAESKSTKGTIRKLHFQNDQYSQTNYVIGVQGRVLDVVVGLNKEK